MFVGLLIADVVSQDFSSACLENLLVRRRCLTWWLLARMVLPSIIQFQGADS